MPRLPRIVIPGHPHHVTQRRNNPQAVFFVEDDRRAYLGLLKKQAQRFGLGVHAYCLMTNQSWCGRRLRPLPVGSPKKNRSKAGKG